MKHLDGDKNIFSKVVLCFLFIILNGVFLFFSIDKNIYGVLILLGIPLLVADILIVNTYVFLLKEKQK